MKFKPGDLVKVNPTSLSLELSEGSWVPRKSMILGTVLEAWIVDFIREDEDKPIYMYKVLVEGKVETKNENSIQSLEDIHA